MDWAFAFIHNLFMPEVKAFASLRICADSLEHSMITDAIRTNIACAGPYFHGLIVTLGILKDQVILLLSRGITEPMDLWFCGYYVWEQLKAQLAVALVWNVSEVGAAA